MIPNSFEYVRADSVKQAVELLARHGEDAKLLAGGHSLIPAMKLRLHAPTTLIDISGISALTGISRDGDQLRVGAFATHRTVEFSDVVKKSCPVLAEAAGLIGDPQVRNRGTLGGSLAHADPAADYPALVLALDAQIHVSGKSGDRTIAADTFFKGLFETDLQPDEVITGVTFPVLGKGTGAAYEKFPHPASRFAVVGVAAVVSLDSSGTCTAARIGVTGAAATPFRAQDAENALVGNKLDRTTVEKATKSIADPANLMSDLIATAEYRAHLCSVLATRAVHRATERAS
ncbi:MAG: xanthine dehydrogenase family protein subunit M [Calditrichaeota bacterium]|nr:MAG: xanthine dehydrogenase family protein subunit M [Calditrichota bacterium]